MVNELEAEYETYKDVINNSIFREKIGYLIQNPDIAFTPLTRDLMPCCWGTVAFLTGKNKDVKELWENEGNRLDDYSDACGNYVCIPEDSSPGYIGEGPMELLLSHLEETNCYVDSVIAFHWDIQNTELYGHRLRHVGLSLCGEDRGIMFHQQDIGERFAITPIDRYVQDFSPDVRKTLEIKLYEP